MCNTCISQFTWPWPLPGSLLFTNTAYLVYFSININIIPNNVTVNVKMFKKLNNIHVMPVVVQCHSYQQDILN